MRALPFHHRAPKQGPERAPTRTVAATQHVHGLGCCCDETGPSLAVTERNYPVSSRNVMKCSDEHIEFFWRI